MQEHGPTEPEPQDPTHEGSGPPQGGLRLGRGSQEPGPLGLTQTWLHRMLGGLPAGQGEGLGRGTCATLSWTCHHPIPSPPSQANPTGPPSPTPALSPLLLTLTDKFQTSPTWAGASTLCGEVAVPFTSPLPRATPVPASPRGPAWCYVWSRVEVPQPFTGRTARRRRRAPGGSDGSRRAPGSSEGFTRSREDALASFPTGSRSVPLKLHISRQKGRFYQVLRCLYCFSLIQNNVSPRQGSLVLMR